MSIKGARAGGVEFIVGHVYVDGQPPPVTAAKVSFLKVGQVMSTGTGTGTGTGRAEVLLGPAVFLRLAEQSAIRMGDSRLDNTAVEVRRGTALVEVVDTEFKRIGLYRFEAKSGELRVLGGDAQRTIFTSGLG